jgi:hypothetical protein
MVVGEVAEQLVPGLRDVAGVLDQSIGVVVDLSDLTLGSVVAQEPVVASGPRPSLSSASSSRLPDA